MGASGSQEEPVGAGVAGEHAGPVWNVWNSLASCWLFGLLASWLAGSLALAQALTPTLGLALALAALTQVLDLAFAL